jgi:hypothetical protein
MKKILLPFFLLLQAGTLYSQVDSSRLEFFPLHKGDTWQYYYGNYNGGGGYYKNQTVVTMDTLMPNGFHYVMVTGSPYYNYTKFYRIDSLMRIQEYYDFFGDTCGGAMNEANVFRLAEKDSSIWKICYNVADQLIGAPYLFRYNSMGVTTAFDSIRDVMIFQAGGKSDQGDTTFWDWSPHFVLMRGVGLYNTEYGESNYTLLTGAIVNGVKYGTIQDGVGEIKSQPYNFELSQNYPNPFNPTTKIRFNVPIAGFVSLKVYDVLGRQVATLVNERKLPGTYEVIFDASKLSSGLYFYRMATNRFTETKKMILTR